MNTKKLLTTGLLSFLGCTGPVLAADVFSVDMDVTTPGIQPARIVAPGDTFQIELVLVVDANGVSSYGVSALFDTAQLQLNPTTGGAAANSSPLPGGLSSLSAPMENNALGQVYSFNGATLGVGPASTTFTIGTINFTVPLAATVLNDAVPDITLGFFNAGVDGFFDNAGGAVTPTFNNGFLVPVPEPSTWAVFTCGTAMLLLSWRRRRSG